MRNSVDSLYIRHYLTCVLPCVQQVVPSSLFLAQQSIMSGGIEALQLKEEDVLKLLAAGVHLGASNVDYQMESYVYKRKPDGKNSRWNSLLRFSNFWFSLRYSVHWNLRGGVKSLNCRVVITEVERCTNSGLYGTNWNVNNNI